ncbi:30S ribosomal protein S5 [Candidatus Woesearchaeota archaeon]|nr:30S ribosomal protein S5 [Candidatus Woesearchaeota archaeon]
MEQAEEPKSEEAKGEEVIVPIPVAEERIQKRPESGVDVQSWRPKTGTGKRLKSGEIQHIDQILERGIKIMEPEIVDILLPGLETDLLMVGQSKGKFGGGARRVFRQTQKKTNEGNKPKFLTAAIIGNRNGYVGLGLGKAKETVPAREKALRNARQGIMKVVRGCGSWQCGCREQHSIPFRVTGKCGSAEITLIPAPKGTGLRVEKECAKILQLAGIKDVWSKTRGQTVTKLNLVSAAMAALRQIGKTKIQERYARQLGMGAEQ